MDDKNLKIAYIIAWTLILGHLLLISMGALIKIMHWSYWQGIMVCGLFCMVISWLLILTDMIRNRFYNRSFWLMSMFILPCISPVIYLIKREKLIGNSESDI